MAMQVFRGPIADLNPLNPFNPWLNRRVAKNIDRILGVAGVFAAVVFFATALTPIVNYASAHFAIKPVVKPSGAIVVLGGGVWNGGMLSDESLRRTVHGIELYKTKLAPLIVFSGPEGEAEIRTELALTMGIPQNAIIKNDTSNTTREESIDISEILESRDVHSILLVTESLHMRRALYLFQRTGLEVYPVPSDNFTEAATSTGRRFELAARIVEESAALIYYRIAGYI
jgi:uncharacterized SAM-binding protein YcdF (DUF218 family)